MQALNFKLSGTVCQGQQLGKKIGFPTANLQIKKPLSIPEGVYLVQVKIAKDNKIYWGMADYWKNPKTGLTFETYIFDFQGDLYNQKIRQKIIFFLRENIEIKSLEALKILLTNDEKEARKIIKETQWKTTQF